MTPTYHQGVYTDADLDSPVNYHTVLMACVGRLDDTLQRLSYPWRFGGPDSYPVVIKLFSIADDGKDVTAVRRWGYYCVDNSRRSLFWLHAIEAKTVCEDVPGIVNAGHLGRFLHMPEGNLSDDVLAELELRALYWYRKHGEYTPRFLAQSSRMTR